MKKKKEEQVQFSHGPQAKREDKLFRLLRWSLLGHLLWLVAFAVLVIAIVLKPDRVVVAERDTGRIVGEYRTTAYRTTDELLAGAVKFARNFLSLNSRTVYDDYAAALNMMTPGLSEKRRAYFERTNLPHTVEMANTRSHLKFEEQKIVLINGSFAKVELAGKIVTDNLKDDYIPRKNQKLDVEDVKLLRKAVPFRLTVDLQMVPVTTLNTAGVQVVDYYEHE